VLAAPFVRLTSNRMKGTVLMMEDSVPVHMICATTESIATPNRAYGGLHDIADNDIRERLLALNLERAEEAGD